MEKFKCPNCGGKGTSIRGEKPRFAVQYSQRGNQVDEYRGTLLNCRLCSRDYSVLESRTGLGWLFCRYIKVEDFYGMEQYKPGIEFIGSTASEWSKRMARGIEVG